MLKKLALLTAFCASLVSAQVDTLVDASINAGETLTLSASKTYVLNGWVFVEDGAVLNIEAGTVIKGMPGTGENSSALIIARGGKIFAEGTPSKPIIFTSTSDDVSNPTDLTPADRGLWGGLIVLGKSVLNLTAGGGGEGQIEGIAATETRGAFGGTDILDNSGVIKYVSIRHGGSEIGDGNEINGLTLGAVGNGTTIEYVEVFSNLDDGIEFFGGTVDTRFMAVSYCGDDGFDYDISFRGRGQFWFLLQDPTAGNYGGEHDGGTGTAEAYAPYAQPVIYNATYIGSGSASTNTKSAGLLLRDNAGCHYANSIFTAFNGDVLAVEDLDSAKGMDSKQQFEEGRLTFKGNILFDCGGGATVAELVNFVDKDKVVQTATALSDSATAWGTAVADPQLASIGYGGVSGTLDPRPAAGSPAWSNLVKADHDWFYDVDYKGAFGENNWLSGWTALSEYGILSNEKGAAIDTLVDASINAGDTVTLSSDTTYILNGWVFVEDGAVLNIEAGTVIKGMPGTGENSSALIIARGGKIYAEGDAGNPIIFTSTSDDVEDPTDLTPADRGLWGGIIVLGKSVLNLTSGGGGEGQIEGIAATEVRGAFGGTDSTDNSGVIKYVSIRHGGSEIGDGNEINGLTLGAVGSGTTIEHVEVFSNLDDGVEFFGGTVNTKNMIVAYCGDDGFDYDISFRGKGQFWFVLQDPTAGNYGGEHDGGTGTAEAYAPYAQPVIYNATYIGSGSASANTKSAGLLLRDNAGGHYANSIFTGFNGDVLAVEDLDSSKGMDSKQQFEEGRLTFKNNILFDCAGGTTVAELINFVDKDKVVQTATTLSDSATAWGCAVVDPQLRNIAYGGVSGILDPRPLDDGAAFTTPMAALPVGDTFFENVNYKGAFGKYNWARGWTALHEYGILTEDDVPNVEGVASKVNVKPVAMTLKNSILAVTVNAKANSMAKMSIVDAKGRIIKAFNKEVAAGGNNFKVNTSNIASGVYFVKVSVDGTGIVRPLVLR